MIDYCRIAKRRSRLECVVAILKELRNGRSLNRQRLFTGTGLNYVFLTEQLKFCVKVGLVEKKKGLFALTSDGADILRSWKLIEVKLGDCLRGMIGFEHEEA